jgi:hypothetical protein
VVRWGQVGAGGPSHSGTGGAFWGVDGTVVSINQIVFLFFAT